MSADPEFAPFAWHDGQALRGASVDVLIAVLKALKLPHGLRYAGPFSRFLVEAQSGRVDIITECRRNPEREAFRLGARGRLSQNKTMTGGKPLCWRTDDLRFCDHQAGTSKLHPASVRAPSSMCCLVLSLCRLFELHLLQQEVVLDFADFNAISSFLLHLGCGFLFPGTVLVHALVGVRAAG